MKILVVEDERDVADSIKHVLEENDHQVVVAYDGIEGLNQAMTEEYGLVILAMSLPKKDGLTVIKELRTTGNRVPVLILTACGTTEDIVNGLGAGSDDHLTKPFALAELLARVNALLRRSKWERGAEMIFADLRLDPLTRRVWRSGNEIDLTAKEYALLKYMMHNPNKPLSRSLLTDSCWGYAFYNFKVDVYITFLRKKVDKDYPTKLIHTVRGHGYMLKDS